MKELTDKLSDLLRPYLPKEKGQVFFKTIASIEESEQGKDAHTLYGNKSHSNQVLSRGIIFDTEYGNHRVLYEHSHRMENGYDFHTILGRDWSDLSEKELQEIHDVVSRNIKEGKVYPALITEGYDESIGIEDHSYFSVVFDKPYDEEQESIADRYECETIDPDKKEYIFTDYDNAIGFAYANSHILESRGTLRREIGSDEWPVFIVTLETADPRLYDLAVRHHGFADYTKLGNPLVIAGFPSVKEARAYRDEAKTLLSAENAVKVRSDIPENDIRNAEHQAKQVIHDRIVSPSARTFTSDQVNTLNNYRAMFSSASSSEEIFKRLFDDVIKQDDVLSKPEQWRNDTWDELSDIAKGVTHDAAQGLKR